MKVVVITGSSRGIGRGLAEQFLDRDCRVVLSGRAPATIEQVVSLLSQRKGPDRVFGVACDVRRFAQVQALWDAAVARFGSVDIWINNAGLGHLQAPFWNYSPEEIQAVVETNVTGALFGGLVALRGMRGQGHGSLYNLEGLGSDGRHIQGMSLYASTKYALAYLTDAWAAETKGTPIVVGALRPGMVVTDLLRQQVGGDPHDWEQARRIFNILGDRVETVTPWLVDRILRNGKNGARLQWLTGGKAALRFMTAPWRKRDLFAET